MTSNCNYHCKFCFARTCGAEHHLDFEAQKKLVKLIASEPNVSKINFVGGEPTIMARRKLCSLLKITKSENKITSITTNGSLINKRWIALMAPYLDILTLSIDSDNPDTNRNSGRCKKNNEIASRAHFISIAVECRKRNIAIKINTVVSKFNISETLTNLINEIRPFRWKIFQVMEVKGENNKSFKNMAISEKEFKNYVTRQKKSLNQTIKIIIENNELMRGSYLMINPAGCFFDSANEEYTVSQAILEIGFNNAKKQIHYSHDKFIKRGGNYQIDNQRTHIGIFKKTKHFIMRQSERSVADWQLLKILVNIKKAHKGKGVYIVNKKLMKNLGLNGHGQNLVIAFEKNILLTLFIVSNLTEYMYQHPYQHKIIL